jgi:aminoglycoside phosphotransferase (APT) family kinase protein
MRRDAVAAAETRMGECSGTMPERVSAPPDADRAATSCHDHGVERWEITQDLATRLVAAQFPRWAHLPVAPVGLPGWDNVTFRLGERLSVRLPSAAGYVAQVEKEHRWLPFLAPRLPLPIPEPVARGVPGSGFPWPWSVFGWLEGEPAAAVRVDDLVDFAVDIAGFLVALAAVDPSDGPAAGEHSAFRGAPLALFDEDVRRAISIVASEVDTAATTAAWEASLAAPFDGGPVWLHGDVTGSNLLVVDGRLAAVLDFGCCAVGDPACDLAIAWTLFHGESRRAFRERLAPDERAWLRGRGWALWKALITLAEALRTEAPDPEPAAVRSGWRVGARGVIAEVLADASHRRK